MTTTPTAAQRPWRRAGLVFLVLGMLGVLLVLGQGMGRDPRQLPSVLIGQPWPAFELPGMAPPHGPLSARSLVGQPRVVNVWASWCTACRDEHPALMGLHARLQAQGRADQLWGLNYKDTPQAALGWLHQQGNPYADSIVDQAGRLGMDLGVYGVPETFVIDAQGVIRYKHVGPLTPEIIERELWPLLSAPSAQGAAS